MKICVAQIEVVPGEPEVNTAKILGYINQAVFDGANVIAFNEMVIPGYLLGDTWERMSFLKECKKCQDIIINHTLNNDVVVIFGNVTFDESLKNEDGRVRKYNTAICAQHGKIIGQNIKTLQPNYREFDDIFMMEENYFTTVKHKLLVI
jgi:NAD+ synthase (glutamine-hydrolysing)